MRRALLAFVAAMFSTCGPPVAPECCQLVGAQRDTPYTGTIAGTGTQVTVQISANGNAVVTFENGAHRVAEGYRGSLQ
ncbi:MAG: hypothetical protein QM817_36335 [Archangium sp.]